MSGLIHARYFKIWLALVALLLISLLPGQIALARPTALGLIFAVAFVKAALVARFYMHLKAEHLLIYAIAGFPLLLVLILALTLIPDML